MEMIFGTLELILGDFVQIKKFELDGDPLYFYGFLYIWGLLNIGLKKCFISRTRKR